MLVQHVIFYFGQVSVHNSILDLPLLILCTIKFVKCNHNNYVYVHIMDRVYMQLFGTVKPLRYRHPRYGHLPQPGSLFYADMQKLWAIQWVWPIIAYYVFILH